MKLAAVILNYNDAEGTVDAIKRIIGFSCFTEIIAVDNASTDDSIHKITAAIENIKDTRLHFVINDKNGGYGYGNNAGVRYAHDKLGAELAVIANPDAVFDESLIISMQRIFEQDRDTAVVGAVMRKSIGTAHRQSGRKGRCRFTNAVSAGFNKSHGRRYIDISSESGLSQSASLKPAQKCETFTYDECIASGWRRRSTLMCMLNSGPVSRRLFKNYINYSESYYKGHDKTVEVYAVHGSLLMVSTDKFTEVGGYDEDMFLYGEENVLAEKLYRSSYKTFLLKQGYEHAGSVSITGAGLKAVKRQQLRNTSENYYYRHYLDCDESGMNIVKLFQRAVLLETRIAAGLHLI